jgi:hypothetical protein
MLAVSMRVSALNEKNKMGIVKTEKLKQVTSRK